jgi:RNA polymerase sigma factor (sigma-70 family)
VSLSTPDVLVRLLAAPEGRGREGAWAAFLEQYSGLILHVARSRSHDHDGIMSHYEFVVDQLRRDDHARLRRYVSNGHGKFATWLLVVVRRLCVDHHRQRYGRLQTGNGDRHAERRLLTDLVGDAVGLEVLADPVSTDDSLLRGERSALLARALARLTPSDRLILRLRFDDELSVPEIARLLKAPSPFVMYRRIEHTLASLRRTLEADGVHSSS